MSVHTCVDVRSGAMDTNNLRTRDSQQTQIDRMQKCVSQHFEFFLFEKNEADMKLQICFKLFNLLRKILICSCGFNVKS